MDSYILDDEFNPVPIAWDDPRNLIGDKENWELTKRMALTKFTSGTRISTVFLGIDHNHEEDGDPILFETTAFDDDGTDADMMVRYATFDKAIQGHKAMVEKVRMLSRDSLVLESEHIKERPPVPPRKLEYCDETNVSILKRRLVKGKVK